MFDLKAKLAAAGAVTEDQIKELDGNRNRNRNRRRTQSGSGDKGNSKGQKKPRLAGESRGQTYDAIRRHVERHRIDRASLIPAEGEERFHFAKEDGALSHLYLAEPTRTQLSKGEAAIVAYMSNHGLAHCVLPKGPALEVAAVMPNWIRKLEGWQAPIPQVNEPKTSEPNASKPSSAEPNKPAEPDKS